MSKIMKKIDAIVGSNIIKLKKVNVIITNNKKGKTITISDDEKSFTFAFEEIEEYLK